MIGNTSDQAKNRINVQLKAIERSKAQLARNLNTMGVSATSTEKFNTLISKVLYIGNTSSPSYISHSASVVTPTLNNKLSALVTQKNTLVYNLNAMGVSASATERFNTLIPKVLKIESKKFLLLGYGGPTFEIPYSVCGSVLGQSGDYNVPRTSTLGSTTRSLTLIEDKYGIITTLLYSVITDVATSLTMNLTVSGFNNLDYIGIFAFESALSLNWVGSFSKLSRIGTPMINNVSILSLTFNLPNWSSEFIKPFGDANDGRLVWNVNNLYMSLSIPNAATISSIFRNASSASSSGTTAIIHTKTQKASIFAPGLDNIERGAIYFCTECKDVVVQNLCNNVGQYSIYINSESQHPIIENITFSRNCVNNLNKGTLNIVYNAKNVIIGPSAFSWGTSGNIFIRNEYSDASITLEEGAFYEISYPLIYDPSNIVKFGSHCFSFCNDVRLDKAGTKTTTIESSAIYGCTSVLIDWSMPNLTSIGSYPFMFCTYVYGTWHLPKSFSSTHPSSILMSLVTSHDVSIYYDL